MNSGTAGQATARGSRQENDSAAGWQFMSAKAGSAWMGSSVPGGVTVPRGPWHYDSEIDLGFGGALRIAATVVTNDPTFGWTAYGGVAKDDRTRLLIQPSRRRPPAARGGDAGPMRCRLPTACHG
ncbi:MAG: hypothetical protein IPL75_16070 [Acidobacteria bacterium]|nr:hypothetical protein [Acidobacteriota bacterium]